MTNILGLASNDFAAAGYVFVQSAGNSANPATSVAATLSAAPASGDLVVAVVGNSTSGTTVSVASTSATWTLASQSADHRCSIFYSVNCTTTTVTASFSSSGNTNITVLHATGASASPLDQVNHGATTDPGSITPTQDGEFIVSALLSQTAISATPSGYTALPDQGSGYNGRAAYLIQSVAAATDPAWTNSGGVSASADASFTHA